MTRLGDRFGLDSVLWHRQQWAKSGRCGQLVPCRPILKFRYLAKQIIMLSTFEYEAVFNGLPIASYLVSPTHEATILAVNDAYLIASSRRRTDLIGVGLFDAFPQNPDDSDDTGVVALRHSLARAIATGRPHTVEVERYPICVEMPNGEMIFEERFWQAVNTPIYGDDGQILCISHNTIDITGQVRTKAALITEQLRSTAALNESEGRLRALIKATADVVYRMSPDWMQMRQLEGRGFLKDTFDPHHLWIDDYIPLEDHELVHDSIEKAIRTKAVFELEHRVLRADGTCGWTLSRAVPMLDAKGEIYEWIGAASDITERKQKDEALQQADQRKDEFLAMLAHELRNPLAPISAAAELLQLGGIDEARVRQTSQIIGRQVAHMTSLVNDLLDVSRVNRGMVDLENAPLDICRIITDAVEQVTPLIRARRQQLGLQLAPDVLLVMGDKKRLVQVFANLLNNAAKYTDDCGNILIKADMHHANVFIEIIDNGTGMAPELVTRAFDLFAQADRTSDRSLGGLGLGLALVKKLVELHHGTVTCESAGLGKGSKFTVCLPSLIEQPALVNSNNIHLYQQQQTDSLRILVVDDNIDAALMIAMLLEASGHQVMVEHGSHRALERALGEPLQVCLIDIGLPDMDGNELAKRLRAQPETAELVLIAVTGYDQNDDRRHALAAGFNHYLVKPVDTKKLMAILAEINSA